MVSLGDFLLACVSLLHSCSRTSTGYKADITRISVRLAGGIISIIRQSNPDDIGLIIADSVLLNIGLIPLLVALIGIIRIMYAS